jgi:hypothetical protein
LEGIDMHRSNIQQGGGKCRCQKIIKPPLPFSRQIREINMRQRAYVNLVAWHKKWKSSGGNVFKKAWKAGINNPRALTLQECLAGIKTCKQLMKEQADQAKQLQHEHLRNRYVLASDLNDTTKCTKIMDIIKQEEQRDEWRE